MINRWMLVFVTILVGGSVWLWASRVPPGAQPRNLAPEPALNHPAPDFTLQTLDGKEFSLAAMRGTPVVLNFWATWCGPCQRELPALQAAAERYDGQVWIVGVDQGEEAETVQAYVDRIGLTFPIPMDTEMEVGNRYKVMGMPTTFFIDANGMIRHTWMGEMNSVTLAEGIDKIWP
jgi:cytochrome c biogenesis protein CcmG, thiol:disulfide interchange protein DsbE